jgi:hypothetical protein
MAPGRDCKVVFSCVTENDPAWFQRVANLVSSVRLFAGPLRDARFVVLFLDDAALGYREGLRELGAEVRVVESFGRRFRHINRLRMLELNEDDDDFDVLVCLDCDTVVVDDFSEWISPARLGAKPVDHDPFTNGEWRRLYGIVGMSPPAKVLCATSSGRAIGPYFNAGVLTVPRALCADLRERWYACHAALTSRLDREPDLIMRRLRIYAEDQVTLSLAVTSGEIPWFALPVAMNFPCHVRVHRSALSSSPRPLILHYHDRIDENGLLVQPRSRDAADAAHRFNIRRAESLAIPYAGLRGPPVWPSLRRTIHGRLRRPLERISARIRGLSRPFRTDTTT